MTRKHHFSFILSGIFLLLTAPIFLLSCEKDPGQGGNSTLYGKVLVKEYNSTFTVLEETYYAPGIWVYLVYGDDRDYSERVQTGPGGVWEFKYLRPGSYKVYALSKDSTLSTNADLPVIREIDISDRKQEINAGDLIIFN